MKHPDRRQWTLALHAYRSMPITFARRVVFGRDPYWRRYFWARWGFLDARTRAAARGGPVLWIEALSGGEVTQSTTFCRELRRALPGWRLVLSTNSRYSFEFAERHLDVDAVFDSPWDLPGPTRRALRALRPAALVMIQQVTCPVLVREARRRRIRTILVSGHMGDDVIGHPMFLRSLDNGILEEIDVIGARSDDCARSFLARGVSPTRLTVTGNMKFDLEFLRVPPAARDALRAEIGLSASGPVLVAGSVHPGEDAVVVEAFARARRIVPDLRLVIAPRYPAEASSVVEALRRHGLAYALRSDRRMPRPDEAIVVDTFGELSRLYSIASLVYVGGTLVRRDGVGLGQNMVEPVAQGKAVVFGPNTNLWLQITEALRKEWPGVEVDSVETLARAIEDIHRDDRLRARLQRGALAVVDAHRNDVRANVDLVLRNVRGTAS